MDQGKVPTEKYERAEWIGLIAQVEQQWEIPFGIILNQINLKQNELTAEEIFQETMTASLGYPKDFSDGSIESIDGTPAPITPKPFIAVSKIVIPKEKVSKEDTR